MRLITKERVKLFTRSNVIVQIERNSRIIHLSFLKVRLSDKIIKNQNYSLKSARNPEKVPYDEIKRKFHEFMDDKVHHAQRTYFPSELLSRGSYGYLLSHWFRYFPKKNFLLIDADDIKRKFKLLFIYQSKFYFRQTCCCRAKSSGLCRR